jgi:hypothetical protein
MLEGQIIAYGKKALTIQDENKQQYYALLCDVDINLLLLIDKMGLVFPVKFKINKKKYEGETIYGKRYHAYNVELADLVI